MSSREEILARIRQSAKTAKLPRSSSPRRYEDDPLQSQPPGQWKKRFIEELLGIEVRVFEFDANITREHALESLGVDEEAPLLSWSPHLLPPPFQGWAEQRGLSHTLGAREWAQAEFGVTGVDAAIAETGTLALLVNEHQPRFASLLPSIHIAIVRESQILPTLGAFLHQKREAIEQASTTTFVTGPSRTADIELALTMGVHGPKTLMVVILSDTESQNS